MCLREVFIIETKLENIISKIIRAKNLTSLLTEHFNCTRDENMTLDWYSVTRLFEEYTELSYVVESVLKETEKSLKEVTKEISEERRNQNDKKIKKNRQLVV